MYCSECGHEAAGKFCSNCGNALSIKTRAAFDWRESCDYQRVTKVDEVRRRIENAKAAAGKRVSGSRVLELVDAAATPLTGGLSSLALAKIAQPISARFGMKTGKQRRESLPHPPGVVLANLAVSLASVEHTIASIQSQQDQCEVVATLPADLRAMESSLKATVKRSLGGSMIIAEALIEGQWYDWGKCQSGLDRLFADLRAA